MPLLNFIGKQISDTLHMSADTAITKMMLFAKAIADLIPISRSVDTGRPFAHVNEPNYKAPTQSRSGFHEVLLHIYGEEDKRLHDDKSLDGALM
jgi:hypothetical protein